MISLSTAEKGLFTQSQIHPQELPEDMLLEKSHKVYLNNFIDISCMEEII